ncbi:MAG: TatD family hydrolase [Promicromonosporaceae bacterium]|nr:TatD family hydrolase [Promicromonosporaceae bacterium]
MPKPRERGFPVDPEPLPIPVADNHTHLDHIGYVLPKGEPPPTVAEHVARAAAAGVDRLIQVGCDLDSTAWTDALLRREPPAILGAVALHPNEAVLHADAHDVGPDGLMPRREARHNVPLVEAIDRIAAIAAGNPRIRVIGETGLDYFRTGPKGAAAQRESFRAHIALAKAYDLVLQIHDRDAHADVLSILKADGAPERTVFHCFSGDVEMAELAPVNGWYLSFAGPITYRANDQLRAALRAVPLSQVLVETDAPYLTPMPFRGQPNAPYVVAHTVRAIADVLRRPLAEVCATISATSNEVYGPW